MPIELSLVRHCLTIYLRKSRMNIWQISFLALLIGVVCHLAGAMSDYETGLRPPAALATTDAAVEKLEPFRPGASSTQPFNKYPEHYSTPAATVAKNRHEADGQDSLHSRSWIHTASNHSCATRSIVKMNIR